MMLTEKTYEANGFTKSKNKAIPGETWIRSDGTTIVDRHVSTELYAGDSNTSVRATCGSLERINEVLTFMKLPVITIPEEDPTLFSDQEEE